MFSIEALGSELSVSRGNGTRLRESCEFGVSLAIVCLSREDATPTRLTVNPRRADIRTSGPSSSCRTPAARVVMDGCFSVYPYGLYPHLLPISNTLVHLHSMLSNDVGHNLSILQS
jgi:hypothetical protein